MKILAIEKENPEVKPEMFQAYLKEEAWQVWQLQQQDFIREVYFRHDQSSAVLILECETLEEADQILKQLPLVKHHLITFDLIPLKPYPGFQRLFY